MNRKFGLNVTKEQWKQTLQKVHHHFFSYYYLDTRPMDRRDVNELTSWDLWRIYNGFKKLRSLRWFEFKVREEDATCMRWLKRIWAFTGFPLLYFILFFIGLFFELCAISALFAIVFPFIFMVHLYPILGSWVWCFSILCGFPVCGICLIAKSRRELYGQEGVEVEGHVSDRYADTHKLQLTYFETDGTMCHTWLHESPGPNGYVGPVPMLYLPDRPCAGLPTRIFYANTFR
jgi:hypothetical protein